MTMPQANTPQGNSPDKTKRARPNVVLILADDMGFADLGCTGSEIRTPVLDGLARDGRLLTQMYNCARCCPTRASLLTGLYPHRAGIGHMGADLGTPAYRGHLRADTATLAEHLRADGYRTLMSGKWHVAGDFPQGPSRDWPLGAAHHPSPRQRGFDRFYGILDGATHFFSPHALFEDDSPAPHLPDGFYFTDAITDKAITMVEGAVAEARPFFLYLAHAAPHWPLHAPPEDIARYEATYNGGWDATRSARHEEMNALGLFQTNWDISPRDPQVPPWEAVQHTEWERQKMATYAAMVDRMDQSIGRLVATLKRLGEFDNTLILFLSDNGGCAEFMAEDGWAKFYPDRTHDGRSVTLGNRPDVMPGDALTFQSYDRPWANVSNAPFRLYKHYVHEGGISTPLIAHWPSGLSPGAPAHAPCHVADIVPTILAATGTPALTERAGGAVQPFEGESFLPLLQGAPWAREAPICFEHEGNAALREDRFKLVREHAGPWQLYDMETDRTELRDLAALDPERVTAMARDHAAWAETQGVLDWDIALPRVLSAWGMATADG